MTRQRRAIHLAFTERRIAQLGELGWAGFQVVADTARRIGVSAGWTDAADIAERLEWRLMRRMRGGMIVSTFEVMDR